jgi:hypothetical protein
LSAKVKAAGPLMLSVSPDQKIKIHGTVVQKPIGNQNLEGDFTQNQGSKTEFALSETGQVRTGNPRIRSYG